MCATAHTTAHTTAHAAPAASAATQWRATERPAAEEGAAPPAAEESTGGLHIGSIDGDGRVWVTFSRRVAGSYDAIVHVRHARVVTPLTIEVRPAAAASAHCVVEGGGVDEAIAGHDARFVLFTHDAYGNVRSRGTDAVSAHLSLSDPLNAVSAYDGATSVVAAAAEAYASKANERTRGRPGARESLHLVARAALTTGGEPAAPRLKVNVSDARDGTYQCSYRPANAGEYLLHVNVDGKPIAESPFNVTVLPSYLEPRASTASGRGLKTAVAGQLLWIDRTPPMEPPIPPPPPPISPSPSAPQIRPLQITPKSDHSKISLASCAVPITGWRPFACAGEVATFHVIPRDPSGNALSALERLPSMKVRVVHRESSAHAQVWLGAGAHSALDISYRALHAGPHDVRRPP